jgi:hypothetical protein
LKSVWRSALAPLDGVNAMTQPIAILIAAALIAAPIILTLLLCER